MTKARQVLIKATTWEAIKALVADLAASPNRRPLPAALREQVAAVAEKVKAEG